MFSWPITFAFRPFTVQCVLIAFTMLIDAKDKIHVVNKNHFKYMHKDDTFGILLSQRSFEQPHHYVNYDPKTVECSQRLGRFL